MTQSNGPERRRHRRLPASEVPSLSARLNGGHAVRILDVSRRGVRLESTSRMRPGQTVSIRFIAADASVTLAGGVVRASVARVNAGAIWYETAVSLDADLEFLADAEKPETTATTTPQDAPAPAPPAPPPASREDVDYTLVVQRPRQDSRHENAW